MIDKIVEILFSQENRLSSSLHSKYVPITSDAWCFITICLTEHLHGNQVVFLPEGVWLYKNTYFVVDMHDEYIIILKESIH